MSETVIKIENLKKQYKLGMIGGGTLTADLQSKWARMRGKEDPNSIIGEEDKSTTGSFMALNGVNLEVKKGETLGIIGSNGAGKSTLLKILSRVTAPTEGTVKINGRISSMLEVGTGFHGELTGRENIYLNGAILGMSKAEVDKKIDDIIEFSECGKFIDTPVKRYSSGMYVKLAFSVAAHLDSEILVMDEVLAVGDMKFQEKCLGKMGDVADKEGRTVLYVSHNMNTIQQLCSRCIVLDHGRVIYDGDVEEAIKIYIGNVKQSSTKLDLKEMTRNEEFKSLLGRMKYLEVLDHTESVFKMNEKLRFRLDYDGYKNLDDVSMRVVMNYADGSPVTMVTGEKAIKIHENQEGSIEFDLNLTHVVPGKYSMSIILYQVNKYGTWANVDGIKDVFCFEVVADDGFNYNMDWNHRFWGHVMLDSINIKTIK